LNIVIYKFPKSGAIVRLKISAFLLNLKLVWIGARNTFRFLLIFVYFRFLLIIRPIHHIFWDLTVQFKCELYRLGWILSQRNTINIYLNIVTIKNPKSSCYYSFEFKCFSFNFKFVSIGAQKTFLFMLIGEHFRFYLWSNPYIMFNWISPYSSNAGL